MVHISGPRAQLRVGYQTAAGLGAWSIMPSIERRNTFVFTAHIVEEHPVWMQMSPFDLVVELGKTEWLWRNVTLQRDGGDVAVLLTERPHVTQRGMV